MKGEVLAAFKKKTRAELKSLAKKADIEFDAGRFREEANPQSVRNLQVEAMLGNRAATEAQNKALEGTGATVQDMTIPDPYTQGWGQDENFVKEAEARAVERGEKRGLISEDSYSRAYTEAQQALTQLMVQTGEVSQEQFMSLIQQRGVKGIELQAYQKAFRDMMTSQ